MTERNTLGRSPSLRFADVVAVRSVGFSPFGWIIRRKTRSQWNHIAIGYSEHYVSEALPNGVHINLADANEFKRQWWVQLRYVNAIDTTQRDAMEKFIQKQTGKGYDWRGIIGFSAFIGRDFDDPRRWFCSELALECFRAGGIKLLARKASGITAPGEVVESPLLEVVDYQWPPDLMEWIEDESNVNAGCNTL